MNPYEIEKAIADFLAADWTYTPIRKINGPSTTPTIPFIECYFKPGQMTSLEIQGAGERAGVFMINIFTKKGAGPEQGNAYAGKLEDLFWHKTISGVTCENGTLLPYTSFIGIDEALQACHHSIVIPFSIITEK